MTTDTIILLLCVTLLLVCLEITSDLIEKGVERNDNRPQSDQFRDKNGNHIYYERSIIQKSEFLNSNPDVQEDEIRSFRRLLHELYLSVTHYF